MSISFDHLQGLVLVKTVVVGPLSNAVLRLALDTGATSTLINAGPLVAIGYNPALSADLVEVTTGSGVEYVPRIPMKMLSALGFDRSDFPVLCHTLPPSAGIDGLLGLDFLRGRVLTVDFQQGQITLV